MFQIGGAPVSDDTAELCREVFGDVLYQGYGQTEAVPATMMGPREWFSAVKGSNPRRSAGRPLPFADLQIVDDDARPLPLGEEGEIAVRCDGQMDGYWNEPGGDGRADRRRLGSLTGDIGRLDENGYVYVLDRKDDMIISGGYNIYPAELENVIRPPRGHRGRRHRCRTRNGARRRSPSASWRIRRRSTGRDHRAVP